MPGPKGKAPRHASDACAASRLRRVKQEALVTVPGKVVVKHEVTRLAADNVVAFLQAQGIDAEVWADDAGGTLPALDETRFAQVLVPEADAEEAKRLIAERENAPPTDDEGDEDDDGDEES